MGLPRWLDLRYLVEILLLDAISRKPEILVPIDQDLLINHPLKYSQ